MRVRRIALLNAASPEHQDTTSRNFHAALTDCAILEYRPASGELPSHHNFDGYIITGSKASVYETHDWIADLKQYTQDAIQKDKPILGICFGHQLLASVLGGTVESMGEYELGYHPITKTKPSTLLADIDTPFYSFITHQDIVTELPDGAIQIAETEYGIHGFEHNNNIYGLQSHPEFTIDTAQRVIQEKDTPLETTERALASITIDTVTAAQDTRRVFDNFREELSFESLATPQ